MTWPVDRGARHRGPNRELWCRTRPVGRLLRPSRPVPIGTGANVARRRPPIPPYWYGTSA